MNIETIAKRVVGLEDGYEENPDANPAIIEEVEQYGTNQISLIEEGIKLEKKDALTGQKSRKGHVALTGAYKLKPNGANKVKSAAGTTKFDAAKYAKTFNSKHTPAEVKALIAALQAL